MPETAQPQEATYPSWDEFRRDYPDVPTEQLSRVWEDGRRLNRARQAISQQRRSDPFEPVFGYGGRSFLGMASSGANTLLNRDYTAATRRLHEGTASNEDYNTIANWQDIQEYDRPRSRAGAIGHVVGQIPAFAAEMWVGGPVFRGVSGAVSGARAVQGASRVAQAANLGRRAIGAAAGAAAHTATVGAPRVAESITRRQAQTGETLGEAAAPGAWDAYVETLSEYSGAGIMRALGATGRGLGRVTGATTLANRLGAQRAATFIEQGIINRIPARLRLQGVSNNVGYHGLVGEYLEERFGEVLRAPIDRRMGATGALLRGELGEFAEQSMIEGAAFAIWGGGMASINAARAPSHGTERWRDNRRILATSVVMADANGVGEEVRQANRAEMQFYRLNDKNLERWAHSGTVADPPIVSAPSQAGEPGSRTVSAEDVLSGQVHPGQQPTSTTTPLYNDINVTRSGKKWVVTANGPDGATTATVDSESAAHEAAELFRQTTVPVDPESSVLPPETPLNVKTKPKVTQPPQTQPGAAPSAQPGTQAPVSEQPAAQLTPRQTVEALELESVKLLGKVGDAKTALRAANKQADVVNPPKIAKQRLSKAKTDLKQAKKTLADHRAKLDAARQEAMKVEPPTPAPTPAPSADPQAAKFAEAMAKLTPEDRTFAEQLLAGKSQADFAREGGVSENAVSKRAKKVAKKLGLKLSFKQAQIAQRDVAVEEEREEVGDVPQMQVEGQAFGREQKLSKLDRNMSEKERQQTITIGDLLALESATIEEAVESYVSAGISEELAAARAQRILANQKVEEDLQVPPGETPPITDDEYPMSDPERGGIYVADWFYNFVNKLWNRHKGKPGATLEYGQRTAFPHLPSDQSTKDVAATPRGMGRVPVFGPLFDTRARAHEDWEQSLHARNFLHNIGKGLANAEGARVAAKFGQVMNAAPEGTPEAGTILLSDGTRGFMGDVVEKELRHRGSQKLTKEQRQAVEWLRAIKREEVRQAKSEGITTFTNSEGFLSPIEEMQFVFSRPAIGKRGMPNAKPSFYMGGARSYRTEKEGATGRSDEGTIHEHRIIYEPLFAARVAEDLKAHYLRIADHRLYEDLKRYGMTEKQRFQAELFKRRAEYAAATTTRRKQITAEAKSKARAGEIWGVTIKTDVPQLAGRTFPHRMGRKINRYLSRADHPLIKWILEGNAVAKGLKFGLDVGAPLIQLAPLMTHRPDQWGKALFAASYALGSPAYASQFYNDNYEIIREMIEAGANMGYLQDHVASLSPEGLLGKAKGGVGAAFRAGGRFYQVMMDAAKVEIWNGLRDPKITPIEQRAAVIESIENSIGHGRMEASGMTKPWAAVERLFFLAPMYYRAGVGSVATMFQGGVSGSVARRSILSFATGISLLSAAGMLAAGLGWDEILRRMNPRNRNFLTVPVRLGDNNTMNVRFGHFYLSLYKLGARLSDWSPRTVDTGDQGSAVMHWLRGHSALFPGLAFDGVTGRDYLGNRMPLSEAVVRRFEPMWLEQIMHGERGAFRGGWNPQNPDPIVAAEALAGFIGLTGYASGERDQYYQQFDRFALSQFNRTYNNLTFPEAARVAREVERRGGPRPPTTIRGREIAQAIDMDRVARMMSGIRPAHRILLNELRHPLPGYRASLSTNGVNVPIPNADRYERFLIEEYDRTIARWNRSRLLAMMGRNRATADNFMRRELTMAKERAQVRLRREWR